MSSFDSNLPEAPLEPVPVPKKSPLRLIVRIVVSLALGLMVGVVLHYLVYRLSLPSKPFIYVAF